MIYGSTGIKRAISAKYIVHWYRSEAQDTTKPSKTTAYNIQLYQQNVLQYRHEEPR